jgi:polyribonucleotide nucleotidyltransferase
MGDTINPSGKSITAVETDLFGHQLRLEINRVGFRTSASVLVSYGDTVILGTAMVGKKPLEGFDYFPLSIDYEEKMYASGKISGSRFIKREGRPSDDAVLIGRLIDRPIRPLWPKGYRHEVQGVATVLSLDPNFRPDVVAMVAVSTAFMLTGAPFEGPVAGLRVGLDEKGEFGAFMPAAAYETGGLDLVVAGKEGGIMMVEASAKEVSEEKIIEAFKWAQAQMAPILKLQEQLVKKAKVVKQDYELSLPEDSVVAAVNAWCDGKLGQQIRTELPKRRELVNQLRDEMEEHFAQELGDDWHDQKRYYHDAFELAIHNDVRQGIVQEQLRPDGRKLTDIRALSSEVGLLPRTHGSSLFTRGVTQAMNIVTLAPLSYAQMVDTMERDGERRFLHHYNAPGYTVGEVRRLGSPGRREIGHGYLAERALTPVLPDEATFPYTIRSVTEIMSQNGSTSMAATCASCLAMMDAGVPIARPVSGIAMGLMMDGDKPYVLSDIADAEDFAGDMDFKVTGTEQGITALQMDMKVHGLDIKVLEEALERSKEGRSFVLEHMVSVLSAPRPDLHPDAPRVEAIKIDVEQIREVIGKGGEVIQKITAETNTEIDIQDDGTVMIASKDRASIEAAKDWIKAITAKPEIGTVYDGTVVKLMDFGAFVEFLPGKDGMVHISEIAEERVEKVSDKLAEGDKVQVKLIAVDDRGRYNLSIKRAK